MTEIKGYKATLWSGMPKFGRRRTPYSVGGVYSVTSDLVLCRSGLHFCRRLCHVYGTYDSAFYTRVFEVEARGKLCSSEDKLCTDRLKFIRELTPEEILLQLADDANYRDTASFTRIRVMNILYSVIMREPEIKDLNTNIMEAQQEWYHMPASYHASRRLQWAQAFNEYSGLPICCLAMNDCCISKTALVKVVEYLRQDPALQMNNDEQERKNYNNKEES
jgi:hypothetical protein